MEFGQDFWLKLFGLGGLGSFVGTAGVLFTLWLRGYRVFSEVRSKTTAADDDRDERSYKHLEAQLIALQTAYAEQNEFTKEMLSEHRECREDFAEARTTCWFLYEQLKGMHATMSAAGMKPPPLVDFPKFIDRHNPEPEYKLRQAVQNSELLVEQISNHGNGNGKGNGK